MDYNHSNTRKKIKINRIVLAIEILLVLGICGLISSIGISSLYSSANGTATEVDADYGVLINGYLTTFNTLSIMVEEKIQENPTFDEMNQWLQSMETTFQKAVGSEIYDGFALTYKGGYARSWSYGEYSDYDPSTRPWYQRAQSGDGKTEVVAPYVTYLDASYFEDDEYILMSITKKYDEEISFDYDIKISEIKRLLMQRVYDYDDTHVILYDPEGYILSTNYEQEYAHNINQTDDVITSSMQKEILSDAEMSEGLNLHVIDGKLKIFYTSKDSRNNTFCIMYPFWEVFTQNFLGVILMGLVMIAAALYLYRNVTVQNPLGELINFCTKQRIFKTCFAILFR
ncbi:MAG: cache domain-containing protein [Lachnospiraceae bacterium]|nr:cache domain-containing protein [Lachnospiraceae bacterium]MDD3615707.1 cache domain-containing protein [Lachnospiraceae bacterium]